MLPGIKAYATCIRFNPHLFVKKSTPDQTPLIDLPYRMVWAVGTSD
jgi:hypothetical protein